MASLTFSWHIAQFSLRFQPSTKPWLLVKAQTRPCFLRIGQSFGGTSSTDEDAHGRGIAAQGLQRHGVEAPGADRLLDPALGDHAIGFRPFVVGSVDSAGDARGQAPWRLTRSQQPAAR